jgi:spore maturation protein CgeB
VTKILLVSSFEPWSIGLSYFRAFQQLGQEIACFDMTAEYERSSPLTRNRYTNRMIMPFASRNMSKKLLATAKEYKPDLIFVHKGSLIDPKTVRKLKDNTSAALYIFNPDDPFNPNHGASNEFIRNSISIYDIYFIWSKTLISNLKQAGARQVEYLPFAGDPTLHYPAALTKDNIQSYGSDTAFIGNWDEERERWLSELEEYNLTIWGTDYWGKKCRNKFLRSSWKGRTVIGDQMSKVVQSSKINLNILRLQNKGAHNMRTFEIPACGGFMLHERSEELLELFEEGKEIDCFSTAEELKNKIIFYLKNDNLRMKIAEAGYQRLLKSGYCYMDRAKQILEFIKN